MHWAPNIAHWAGLIPLFAVMLARPPAPYVLIAAGFGMSWIGDLGMLESGGSWAFGYGYLPFQLGLILVALAKTWAMRVAAVCTVSLVTLIAWQVTFPEPDVLIRVMGSLAILWLAVDRVVPALWIYFGVGTLAYLWMLFARDAGAILPAWYIYQSCRLVAYAAFCWALWKLGSSPPVRARGYT